MMFSRVSPYVRGLYRPRHPASLGSMMAIRQCTSNAPNCTKQVTFEKDTHYKLHKLDEGPSTSLTITRDDALKFYKQMLTIRCMEIAAEDMCKEKLVHGPCHLYCGQEAICVGIEGAVRRTDAVITSYRVHGWAYTRGISILGILAEIAGRASGCGQGKTGSMHMFGNNFYGGHGVVGSQVPLGAGIALAMKYQGTDNVCVTLYGDGAANQGQVFEAYNMAKLWDLPCIFVCENNQYGKGTSVHRAAASTAFYTRGDYIPGIWVDGMDAEYCRSGKGPMVIECDAYRYGYHHERDQGTVLKYRTQEEIETYKKRDPITSFRDRIINSALITEEEIEELDKEVKTEVDDNVRKVKADPVIAVHNIYRNIYKENPDNYTIRGCDALSAVKAI